MFSHFFQPCITEPTRVVMGNRPSLVDNIFINTIGQDVVSGNLTCKITDHMPNFILINDFIQKRNKMKRRVRDFKTFNEKLYLNEIRDININSLLDAENINEIYDNYHDQLIEIINRHAPYKTLTNKEINGPKSLGFHKIFKRLLKQKIQYIRNLYKQRTHSGTIDINFIEILAIH